MKISAKQISLAAAACLFFLPGMAEAACNSPNGTTYILEIGGYTASTVELGVTNTFTLRIKNEITGVYLTSGQIDASAITWVPGVFTTADSNGDGLINSSDLHVISIKLIAGTNAVSSSPTDLKTITCRYDADGWTTDGSSGCQVSTSKYCIDTDVDGDGLTYLQEASLGSNPFSEDSDGDTMPDGYESWVSGLSPTNPNDATSTVLDMYNALDIDPDGDGAENWFEDWKETNPADYFD